MCDKASWGFFHRNAYRPSDLGFHLMGPDDTAQSIVLAEASQENQGDKQMHPLVKLTAMENGPQMMTYEKWIEMVIFQSYLKISEGC